MDDTRTDPRFDELAAQVHDWTESAVALDEGHFPNELLSDLEDLIVELKAYLEESGAKYERRDFIELFVSPEMAEIVERFPRVRRLLERAWGSQLTELLEDEASEFDAFDDDDEDD